MTHFGQDPTVLTQVLASVGRDVRRAVSQADLRMRLARKGFGVREGAGGPLLVTMPHGVEIGPLPRG
ncbi:MAG: hypothetical protein ACU0CI_10145 [Shimia sp.]